MRARMRARQSRRAHRVRLVDAVGFGVRAGLDQALDAAFPARCVGCRAEGPPICTRCAPALDARLDLPAGVPIGLPGDLPDGLVQID